MIYREEYEKAYVEVIEILKYLPKEIVKKVPENLIYQMENNKKKQYQFTIDRTKKITLQISDISKAILANIYIDYWASEYEKEIINAKEKRNRIQMEINRLKKYPKLSLFQNKRKRR